MSATLEFETPENITINYEVAGPGTRFVAWVFDMMLVIIAMVTLALVAGFWSLTFGTLLDGYFGRSLALTTIALILPLISFVPLLYFLLFELFMHGQTPGKRSTKIRVVRADGFSLTFGAIFIRNIFRLVDTMPLLWVVPVLSSRTQRFGDMVAGTVVVTEDTSAQNDTPMHLLRRSIQETDFTFTGAELECLEEQDIQAVESVLARKNQLSESQAGEMIRRLVLAFSERMRRVEPVNGATQQQRFLEDLLIAYYHRQARELQ